MLASTATLFIQAVSLQQSNYEAISVGDAIPIKPTSAVGVVSAAGQ